MGTTWSVQLLAARDADLRALHAGVQAQLDAVVAQMSTWEPDSAISRCNRAPAGTWHPLPEGFARVLDCALQVARASDGAFDPTLGALLGLWGFGPQAGDGSVPAPDALHAARAHCGWQRIRRDDHGRLYQPGGLQLDLSAIAKGDGADQVAAWLRAQGVASALVEVGGELYGYGRKPDGQPWRVLVEAGPEEDDRTLPPCVLALEDCAVATSGDRWHHYLRAGQRYTHTIDPRRGRPIAHAPVAVSVIAETAMLADAWATALSVLDRDAGFELANQQALGLRHVWRDVHGIHARMNDAFRTHLAA